MLLLHYYYNILKHYKVFTQTAHVLKGCNKSHIKIVIFIPTHQQITKYIPGREGNTSSLEITVLGPGSN